MTTDEVVALLSDEGRALLEESNRSPNDRWVADARKRVPSELLRPLPEQRALSSKLRDKLPHFFANGALAERSILEQATNEPVARFHASLLDGAHVVDATGGLGVDTVFFLLANPNAVATFCEIDSARCALFAENSRRLGVADRVTIFCGDSMEYLSTLSRAGRCVDLLYIDPARRDSSAKGFVALAKLQPNIIAHYPLICSVARRVVVKLSPAFDVSALFRELPDVREIFVVASGGEVREVCGVLDFGSPLPTDRVVRAVSLEKNGTLVSSISGTFGDDRRAQIFVGEPAFLYEPPKEVIKAGLVDEYLLERGLARFSASGVYGASDVLHASTGGRTFRVIARLPWQRKSVKNYLSAAQIDRASVMRRDFPLSTEELRKWFSLGEDSTTFLLFTTDTLGKKVCFHLERVL